MQKANDDNAAIAAAYKSLQPSEKILLQVCSVIYEPATAVTITKILGRAGIKLPGPAVARSGSRSPEHDLRILQRKKLLVNGFQCHPAIVETATRDALTAGLILRVGDDLKGMESPSAWLDGARAVGGICFSCGLRFQGPALKTSAGPLCRACAGKEARAAVWEDDFVAWPPSRFKEALSPGGSLRTRLMVLWRFQEVRKLLTGAAESVLKELAPLLVDSLGYNDPHPASGWVRDAAVEACVQLGDKVLPLLLGIKNPQPAEFRAGVVRSAGLIAPEDKKVKELLEKATDDPDTQVRIAVAKALSCCYRPSSADILQKLVHDKSPSVANEAKKVVENWKRRLIIRLTPDPETPLSFGHFGPLVMAIQKELPDYVYNDPKRCSRLMRDFRIGVYTNDRRLYSERYSRLTAYCSGREKTDPLLLVCTRPFDAGWFRTLPLDLQATVLRRVFQSIVSESGLERDEEALRYGTSDEFIGRLPLRSRSDHFHFLSFRLMMGGLLDLAERFIRRIQELQDDYSGGLRGALHFVRGESEKALEAFEADLKELRKRTRKRNTFFTGMAGPFYVMALLNLQDASALAKANQFIKWSETSNDVDGSASLLYIPLNAVASAQTLDTEEARWILKSPGARGGALGVFLYALAEYWVEGRISEERAHALSRLIMEADEAGMKWLVMECTELLRRAEEDSPVLRDFCDKIKEETGMVPFSGTIRVDEPWRRRLRALIQSVSEEGGAKAQAKRSRLAWLIEHAGGEVALHPVEQKLNASGIWTNGRPVALSRFFNGTGLDFMTDQDRAIRAGMTRKHSSYYGVSYSFDMEKVLPSLAGHPLLFLSDSPGVRVEFVKGDAEIVVTQGDRGFNIKFSAQDSGDRFQVIQETPTRFKVVEFTEKHRLILKALGKEGLTAPSSARDEVVAAITAMASLVTVHSAIGGTSEAMEEIEGDPAPRLHLLPYGGGFKAEIFTKPFRDGGPFLKPGVGAANVIADVDGKKTLAKRDLKREKAMAGAVETSCATLAGFAVGDGQWRIDDPQECLQVLLELKALQDEGGVTVEWPEGEKLRVTREASFDRLRMKIRSRADWFEVEGRLELDGDLVIDIKKLLEMLHTSPTRFIPLGEGKFLTLTRQLRRLLEELDVYSERRGKEIRLHPLVAPAVSELIHKVPDLDADGEWKRHLERIQSVEDFSPAAPSTLKAELRDYQLEGYRWMARLARLRIGACLADDMGLGKTIQALAAILDRAPGGPALVVAPTSVCPNWVDEAARFAPTLNVAVFGNGNRAELIKNLKAFDLVVASYGLLLQETELLSSVEWGVVVLDEAQAIKNVTAKRSQAAMQLKGKFKIITTGTPVENHLGEFWTLFNFLNPGLLGSHKRFRERFALPIEKENDPDARKRLKKLIQPFILRRTKAQVLEELPSRTEVALKVEMSPKEAAFYEALRLQALENVAKDDHAPAGQKQLRILAEIMKLRRACCNPRLVAPEAEIPSSKLELFGEIVSELLENRHKALVFSQFVGHLAIIREYLDGKGIKYRYLDGSTPAKDRKQEVDAFQAGDGDLFLISLKAGGLGLNLTAADYVIHMDPWWNPAVEDQASDRAHRIGQLCPVTVYRLVSKNTIEEKIVKLHQEKRDLAGSLLEGADISAQVSAEELLKLIKEEARDERGPHPDS